MIATLHLPVEQQLLGKHSNFPPTACCKHERFGIKASLPACCNYTIAHRPWLHFRCMRVNWTVLPLSTFSLHSHFTTCEAVIYCQAEAQQLLQIW